MAPSMREALIKDLKGKTIYIHDLGNILPGWSQRANLEVQELRDQIEAWLDTLFDGKRRAKLKAIDPTGFAAQWWPYAGLEQMRIATCLFIWLFAWDDEMDSIELSMRSREFDAIQNFRSRTLNFVRQSLGFAVAEDSVTLGQPESNPVITSFEVVAEALITSYTLDQREHFLEQIEFFVEMSTAEQTVALGDSLPSVDEYLSRRMGTSGVLPGLAMTELCYGMVLPPSIMHSEDMKQIQDATNVIIAILNDILSIHKEIHNGQVDTLIPILFQEYKDVQTAADAGLALVKTAVHNFETASRSLLQSVAEDDALTADVGRFIEGCRYACTSNSNWSLTCGRYGLRNAHLEGVIEIPI